MDICERQIGTFHNDRMTNHQDDITIINVYVYIEFKIQTARTREEKDEFMLLVGDFIPLFILKFLTIFN